MSIPICHLFATAIVIHLSPIRMTSRKYLSSQGYYRATEDVYRLGWHSYSLDNVKIA